MKAKEIKELRRKLGLNQKGLAEALGCKLGTIENYEQGKRAPSEVFEERLQKLKKRADKMAPVDKAEAPE
jgi:DNA-binding transcriptional regulator YiaG